MDSTPKPWPALLRARWLGRCDFSETLQLQQHIREQLLLQQELPTLLLAEHPPTLTLGRRANPIDILWSPHELSAAGINVCETPRGGEVTLHAPGQLVVYPIMYVGRHIRAFITCLANAACQLLAELGISQATFNQANPGIWVGDYKLGSIGLHIRRGVSIQGLSVNLDIDPQLFSAFIPCGMHHGRLENARSFAHILISTEQAAKRYASLFAQTLATQLQWDIDSDAENASILG